MITVTVNLGQLQQNALSSHHPHTLSPSRATCKSCSTPSHAELWALACLCQETQTPYEALSAALARQPQRSSTAYVVLRWGMPGLSYHYNTLSKAWSKTQSWPSNSLCISPAYWQHASLGSKAHFPPSPLWQRFLAGVISDCPWLKSHETSLKNVWLAVWKDCCNIGTCFNLLFADSQWFPTFPSPVSAGNMSFMHWKLRSAVFPGLQEVELQEQ